MINGFIEEVLPRQVVLWSGKGVVDLEIYSMLKEDYMLMNKLDHMMLIWRLGYQLAFCFDLIFLETPFRK
ncbi:hypothetical protein [Bacillus pumilus]|uniref:hypothetical protein n=1 Tax=Bacillus pumilus TaxID=1408 RepID=UPI000DDD1F53|nr:hypothetical protein [Bacillus pumilus]